jgi:imidazolonepropionase-like amidohydrolase
MMIETLRRAREGGVTVAFGTDTGVSKHGDNAGEFDLMVEAGYTPEVAIRTATVVASEHVEMADMIGTITAGKHADIIAVTGDPLKDIGELHDIDFVMKGGTGYKQAQ